MREKLSLLELQKLELEILIAFHNFCIEHSLRYYLAGGTLLGAIRHKGFIPWDDDIDVCMPRPDYMRFLELCKNGKLDENRTLNCRFFDKDCPSSMLRIYDNRTEITFSNFRIPYTIGCWIDVFFLDGVEREEHKRKAHFKEMRLVLDLFICCLTKFGGKRRSKLITILQYGLLPVLPIIRAFGYKFYLDWYDRIAQRYKYEDCEYVGVLEGRAVEKEAMRKADMEPAILVDFEGYKFYTMANYHEYLTNLYGNYMQLPPEEDRVSRHEINIYWREGKK